LLAKDVEKDEILFFISRVSSTFEYGKARAKNQ